MAKFGPGTKTNVKPKDKNWKVTIGAIENKNRPEAVYVLLSTWFRPKLSVVQAKQHSTNDPNDLVKKIVGEFKREIDLSSKKFASMFNSKYFDASSLIFTYDFAEMQAQVGKSQFLELELNIDTINDIDRNGDPAPTKAAGKIETIPFKDFESPLLDAINKILSMEVFSKSKLVDFSLTKGG